MTRPLRALRALAAACALATLAAASAARPAHAQRYVPGEFREFPKVKYADSLESMNDRCIVKKTRLSLAVRPVYVNWRPIGFCCETSVDAFLKNPEKYLKDQKIDMRCVVNQGRHAAPDPKRRMYVNYEIFYLSTTAALTQFKKHTLQYCGWLTDPVSRAHFRPTASSPRAVYNGRPYYFSTISNRMKFEAMPDSFAVRRGS
jgi:YHS domain-containing protein